MWQVKLGSDAAQLLLLQLLQLLVSAAPQLTAAPAEWNQVAAGSTLETCLATLQPRLTVCHQLTHTHRHRHVSTPGIVISTMSSSSSSPCSVPLQERCRFHDFTTQLTVICSVPGRPQTQVLMFEVVLYCTQPRRCQR